MIGFRKENSKGMKDKIVPLTEHELSLKRKLFSIILFAAYPAYIVNSCVVSPIYTVTDSNVAYNVLPLVFFFLGIIIDLAVIYLSLAVIIYGMYKLPTKALSPLIALTLSAPIFKNLLKIIVSPFVDGVIDTELLIMDIYSLSVSCVLEILQLAIVLIIAYPPFKKYKARLAVVEKASDVISREKLPDMRLIPFNAPVSIKNPLQFGALISGIVITLIRLLMRLINDLGPLASPSLDLIFFLPYVLSLVSGMLGYLFMIYVFISIASKTEEL